MRRPRVDRASEPTLGAYSRIRGWALFLLALLAVQGFVFHVLGFRGTCAVLDGAEAVARSRHAGQTIAVVAPSIVLLRWCVLWQPSTARVIRRLKIPD